MEDLKQRTVRGGMVKLVGQAANFALRLGFMVALARLLDPADFGLVAMVTVVTGVYEIFTTAGLSAATVQRSTVTNEQISALFWINLLVGVVLGALCVATAPILVRFYHEPRLFWVTIVLGSGFLFNAAGVQHYALLQRDLRYVPLTVIELASLAASIVVGVGMALAGFGYWSLVGSAIVAPAVNTVGMWAVTAWIPKLPQRGIDIRSMLHFGGTITLNSLVVYIGYNFEKVLLGRFWGAEALGIYGRAYQLINIPTGNLNSAIGVVAFSALSRLQEDPARFKSYFLKGYSLVLSMTVPITIFCALGAEDIVLVVLGPKWMDAVPVFRLLTPTVLIFGMINPLVWLLQALGYQVRSLKLALVIAPLVITAYVIGLPYGPNGVAFAYSAAMTLWLVPHVVWCLYGTMISPLELFRAVSRPLLSGVVAAAVVFALRNYIGELQSPFVRLLVAGSLMSIIYAWMLLFIMGQKTFYFDVLRGLKSSPRST
jgi:PST family polysaccharide transporter